MNLSFESGNFSRSAPSPRYAELLFEYQLMHSHGDPEQGLDGSQVFPGQSLTEHVLALDELKRHYGFQSLTDYGCGKAMLYRPQNDMRLPDGRQANCLQDLLGLKATLYDPAYLPYAQFPQEQSDLVVCTDVLEHCPPEDVPWIVEELFMLARKFVFANIACYPARKYLRNGENAHCTVAPVEWWSEQIWRVAQRYANIDYRFICKDADGKETFIANPLVVD